LQPKQKKEKEKKKEEKRGQGRKEDTSKIAKASLNKNKKGLPPHKKGSDMGL
jgi:hypothetical protein